MDEHEIRLGCHAGRPALSTRPRRDARNVCAVTSDARVGIRRVIAECGVRIFLRKRIVDRFTSVNDAVAVGLRRFRLLAAALIPERENARGAIRLAKIRVAEIQAPIHDPDDNSPTRHRKVVRPTVIGVSRGVRRQ